MQNTENEKLTWEAARLILNNVNETQSGQLSPDREGQHTIFSTALGS
jgi:hypothetical protein